MLNACPYCYGVHAETAKAFGVDAALIEQLVSDLDRAPVEARMRPLLQYARKLTLEPARMTQRAPMPCSPPVGARPSCTMPC